MLAGMKKDRSADISQATLLLEESACRSGVVFVNDRCRIEARDGYCVVSVSGIVMAHYAEGDLAGEAYAMVNLVEQGWARQTEVARAFGCDVRTVRRHQRRATQGGLSALGRPRGYPSGQPRTNAARDRKVQGWKSQGVSNREIARRLGVTEKTVRKALRRLGWNEPCAMQPPLPLESADPKLSGAAKKKRELKRDANSREPPENHNDTERLPEALSEEGADPKLSGLLLHSDDDPNIPISLDRSGEDRSLDRLLACMGMLDDAAPVFANSTQVPGAGVLLAIPALINSGVIAVARDVYGSVGPAFYGLRTTVLTLLLMALLRIRRPEGLKEHSPDQLGRLLGLDRAPEVKTLRGKLARLAAFGRAAQFGRVLAEHRVAQRGHAMGFLYVDGHVRVYHGKQQIPKTHVARMRISMSATTDYWINDAEGDPLFVVPTEANKGLVKMLPTVLEEVRTLVGERRVTVVFDRGGWSPTLFKNLIEQGFDILTYRKGKFRRVGRKHFALHEDTIDGQAIRYVLADQGIRLRSGLRLRQVTRLGDDGHHQTPIVTSRRDLSAIEVAYRMFARWRQENFFKYLREEYALDALVTPDVEAADPTREVPNPVRAKLNVQLRQARAELQHLYAQYGLEALNSREELHRTMRGFKIAHASAGQQILKAMKRVTDLERRRAKVPTRVPVRQVVKGEVVKMEVERKHLTDILKMVAYQAESDLFRMLAPSYRRAEEEGRTLIQNALAATGDIRVCDNVLLISLQPLSSPHRTKALSALCREINATHTRFPGSKLRLQFDTKPSPKPSLAFPGPRHTRSPHNTSEPDISARG
jgi:DNA-binding CsgD family transcriptional regulator